MIIPDKRLLLTAALGLPVMFAGCQSRAELLTSTSAESPTRTVATQVTPSDDVAAGDAEESTSVDEPADAAQSVSLTGPDQSSPREVLEAAGAVIEFDEQGRALGIDLTDARITPEVTRSIAELSNLQWADLRGTGVTDADLAVICALPQFELLALGQTEITDTGLQHLRQQRRLRFLSLDGTAISDAGLTTLTTLPRLEGLSLSNTSVSKAAARTFEKQNPACRVIIDENAPAGSSSQSTPLRGAADLPDEAVDWRDPAPAGLPTTESQQGRGQQPVNSFDWSEPTSEAPPREEASPTPGEPTTQVSHSDTWYLDATEATVFPQPLPQPSVTQSAAERSSTEPQPVRSAAIQPQTVQISPLQSSPAGASGAPAEETAHNLNQVLQQRLLDPEVLTALSQHLLAQEEYAKAARALEALTALQPDNPQVRFDLGVALARSGNYDRAHSHLAAVVGDATAWYNLGVIAFERDEPQHSERYFGRAIDLAPDFSEARIWLARVRKSSTMAVSPATQAPQSIDGQDLVDLLMSEFGNAGTVHAAEPVPAPNRSAAGITIVPRK